MNEETRQTFDRRSQVDWRDFLITRIKFFAGSTVGSLTPKEFGALCRSGLLARVREKWDAIDDDIRGHYYAITARIAYETALQESREPSAAPPPQQATTGLPLSVRQASEAPSHAEQSEQLTEANQSQEAIVGPEQSRQATEMVLGWIERARDDLRKAKTHYDFKVIKVSAQLVGDFATLMQASTQARTEAEELRLRAERGISLILKDPLTQRHESGRLKWGKGIPLPGQSGLESQKGFSWAKLGIEKNEASRLRKMAKFSDQEFEQRLEEKSQSGDLIRSRFLSDNPAEKRGPKVPSREECLRLLLRLMDQLSRLSERSFDHDFFSSQKLDKTAYQKKRQELSRFLQSVDAFIETP